MPWPTCGDSMTPMANEEQLPRPAPDVTEAGVPAVDEVPEEMMRTGEMPEGEMPPLEHPQGVEEYGTTAAEERRPEPIQDRVIREEPDVTAPTGAGVGPVVAPDTAGGVLDPDTDMMGDEETMVDDTVAPEEAALRQTEDLPGATYDATPGYLDES